MACTCTARSFCRFDGISPESVCAACEARIEAAEAEQVERLYRAYEADRNGSRITAAMTHDQIHSDGVYGDLIDDFGDRYAAEERAYREERDSYFIEMHGEPDPLMHGGYEPRF